MLGINFLFILRKSVNFSVILFSNRKMNSIIVLSLGMVKNSLSIILLYYDRLQSCQLFLQDMSNSVHFLPKCQSSKFQIMVQFNINY